MGKRLCKGLVLAVGISVLFAACSRRNKEQTNSRPVAQTFQAPVSAAPAVAPPPPDLSAVAADRPSAFDSWQATAHRKAAGSRKPAANTAGAVEPLALATAPAANAAAPAVGSLPTPPAIKPETPDVSELPPVLKTLCCVSTATYEPVKPNGLQRVLQKVPGLRRLDPDATADPGYAPPQPVRDVQFAITPDASPMLMHQGRMDLKVTVDASGRVTKVELLSPRDEKLVGLAASAANAWRFAPAELNGSPVPGEVILHFDFDNTPAAQAAIDASKIR